MVNQTVITTGGGNYASLNAWEAGMPATMTDDYTVTCSGGADTTAVNTAGIATNGFTITIIAHASHYAEPRLSIDTNKYRLIAAVNNSGVIVTTADQRIDIIGLQVSNTAPVTNDPVGILAIPGTSVQNIVDCLVVGGTSTGVNNWGGIMRQGTTVGTLRVINTVIVGFNEAMRQEDWTANGTWIIYHVLCYGQTRGMYFDNGGQTIKIKNSAVQNSSGNAYETTGASGTTATKFITDDATSPDVPNRSKTITFKSGTLELDAADTAAKDQGVDLSGDADWAVLDDMFGISRPQGSAYDIGPHEWADLSTQEQEGFRWRNDDGDEDAATWAAAQDTNLTQTIDTPVRLRMLIDNDGDAPPNSYQLEWRVKTSGTWRKVEPRDA